MCVYMYAYTYIHHRYKERFIYIDDIPTRLYESRHTFKHKYTRTHSRSHIHVRTHIHVGTHTHAYTHACYSYQIFEIVRTHFCTEGVRNQPLLGV